jgi:CIC family chloride channel protein
MHGETAAPALKKNPVEPVLVLKHLDRVAAKVFRGLLPEEKRYWLLVPVTGLISGFLAVALEKLLDAVELLAWGSEDHVLEAAKSLPPYYVVLTLTTGGVLTAIALYFLRRNNELQGTSAIIEALAFKKGRLPVARALAEGVTSITAVGTGASLGREGALMQSGAALASFLGVKARLDDYHVRILLACGAAGGIAAAYNVPVGASVFAMEVLLGSFALEIIAPVIVASFLATTVSRAIFGGLPAYSIPRYELVTEWEILLDILLGAGVGLASVAFIRIFSGIGRLFRWLQPFKVVKPIVAMAILGLAGVWFPQLFGNGYDTVNQVLNGSDQMPLKVLIALPILKIVVTGLCRSGGVPGGLFTPSLFVGALLGTAFGVGVNAICPGGAVAKPGAYALVGMGAILAGTIQAPITAILMIFEMTRDYEIIVPLMSACAASAVVSHLFQESSIFTEPLRRRGIRLPQAYAPTWMRQPTVRSVMQPDMATVSPAERFQQVVDNLLLAPEGHDQIYVTNREGGFLGTISLHEIKRFFRQTEHLDSVIAADIVNSSAPFVYADDPLSRAIEMLAESDNERLPVLDGSAQRKLIGTVSKRSLLAAYTETNLAHVDSAGNGE